MQIAYGVKRYGMWLDGRRTVRKAHNKGLVVLEDEHPYQAEGVLRLDVGIPDVHHGIGKLVDWV